MLIASGIAVLFNLLLLRFIYKTDELTEVTFIYLFISSLIPVVNIGIFFTLLISCFFLEAFSFSANDILKHILFLKKED